MTYPVRRHLRRSQAITTFGPGGIVDLREESVIMGGIDFWPEDKPSIIQEPNLERVLQVESFRTPTTIEQSVTGKDLPYTVFPRWLICPKCHRLAPYEFFAGNLHPAESSLKCPDCKKRVYPARLIVACQYGHIDDFPWIGWLKNGTRPCTCEHPALELFSAGRTAALGDLIVRCKNCNGQRSLSGATEDKNLGFMTCSGNRPWLGDRQVCDKKVIPLQRGASNVYFPVSASALSIPPWSRAVQNLLNPFWGALKHIPEGEALRATIKGMNLSERLGMDIEEILLAIRERKDAESGKVEQETITEEELRRRELEALRKPQEKTNSQDNFKTRKGEIHSLLKPYFSSIVLVDRLREVRALLGFSRILPPDPDPQSRLETGMAPISINRKNWLPAIEVFGEGIFFELSQPALDSWIKKYGAFTVSRADVLNRNYAEVCKRRKWKVNRTISPVTLLVHSLAHSLIRQLSLDSGYSSSALRERLYVFEGSQDGTRKPAAAFLIYTSSPDSEGSLGGLVRQGDPERLAITVRGAINEATWCSSDPLCVESEGQGLESLNLAACHACLLLPETCCEEFNRLLDRVMLTGTPGNPEYGFFNGLAEK
jgi:hypothetical protein